MKLDGSRHDSLLFAQFLHNSRSLFDGLVEDDSAVFDLECDITRSVAVEGHVTADEIVGGVEGGRVNQTDLRAR